VPLRDDVNVGSDDSAVRITAEAALNVEGVAMAGVALDVTLIEGAALEPVLDAAGVFATTLASSSFASIVARSVSNAGAGDESAIVALAENDDSLPSTAAPFGSPASAGVRVMTRDSAVAGEVTPGEPARSPPKVACALGGSLASFPSGRSDTPRVLAPL
jgi:hypothetical protein